MFCKKEKAGCKLSAAAGLFLNDTDSQQQRSAIIQKRDFARVSCEINQQPQRYSGLIVNSGLEAVALASTKLDVLGVKL